MKRTLLKVIVVLSVLCIACSSSTKTTSTQSSGPPSPTSDDPRTQAQLDADQKTVEAATLQLSDFASGWEAKPHEESSGLDLQQDLANCLHVDVALLGKAKVRAVSDDFERSQASASSIAAAFPTADRAHEALAIQQKPETRDCYQKAATAIVQYTIEHPKKGAELPAGVTVKEVTVGTLAVDPVGDDSAAFRITVTLNANGLTPKLYIDLVNFTVGRYGATLQTEDTLSPFDESETNALAQKIAARLPAQ